MVYIDLIELTPNSVNTGEKFKIEITLHEEYENAKRYEYRYAYRFGERGEEK